MGPKVWQGLQGEKVPHSCMSLPSVAENLHGAVPVNLTAVSRKLSEGYHLTLLVRVSQYFAGAQPVVVINDAEMAR